MQSKSQHIIQRDWVRASLHVDPSNRTERHNSYPIRVVRPKPEAKS